ncbi:MAG: sulfur carrier protein ThiS [Mariprofundales bacterium]
MSVLRIILNGDTHETKATTIAQLLEELGLQTRILAVEYQLEVIPRSQYTKQDIHENDRIEIVHMIGGG